MRSMGSSASVSSGQHSKTISATPRQLESLIRISQALAKMRLDSFVSNADVVEALRLMRVATQTAATDPRTGTIDMDMITTGRAAADRETIQSITDELFKLFEARKGTRLTVLQIRQLLEPAFPNVSLTTEDIQEALREVPDSIAVFIERTKAVNIRE